MENPDKPFQPESEEDRAAFERFKDEIRKFAEEEASGERKSVHFVDRVTREILPEFNPDELVAADWRIWEEVQSGKATLKSVYEYYGLLREIPENETPMRRLFQRFIGNYAQEKLDK